jgi:3-oxoacyl-[acyl-carrier-protein] synthase-1
MTEEEMNMFDYASVDISEILPQRRPFVMVSRLVSFSWQETVTGFDVTDGNTFMDGGVLEPEGLIENVAQSCALRIGFINKYIRHKTVDIGYVCAMKSFNVSRPVHSGESLVTKISVASEFGSVLMVDAIVKSGDEEVASGTMTIALDENKPMASEAKDAAPSDANEYAVVKVADNIISPLGTTTAENYEAIKAGRSALRLYPATQALPEAYYASLIDDSVIESEWQEMLKQVQHDHPSYTRFEKRIILSIHKALQGTGIDPAADDVVFIISSTKGNVDLLEQGFDESEPLGASAEKIARFFGSKVTPLAVSNACISGLCAQIAAMRCLKSGKFAHAVVAGSDIQSRFIISGFQSFKALSQENCRPFDADRCGLNLGEAAATIIFSLKKPEPGDWVMANGAIRNDANHISGPSRTGEGSYRALRAAIGDFPVEDIALVSVHGTSTAYNDEMESKAITRAGLQDVPLNSLKGYYGHTMGAAGILESILSMASIDDHAVLGTRGYSKLGVSCPVNISTEHRRTDKQAFVKLLSGFGGCNAAGIFIKASENSAAAAASLKNHGAGTIRSTKFSVLHHVRITQDEVVVDDKKLIFAAVGQMLLEKLYDEYVADYPKFYKMDPLAKLGFIASELLLGKYEERRKEREDMAVILFGKTASLCDDMKYQQSIQNPEEYYPSPSLFVYTLPNIVTGEIAIRNKYYGETSFYVLQHKDEEVMNSVVETAFQDGTARQAITGWLECPDEEHFECDMKIIEKV